VKNQKRGFTRWANYYQAYLNTFEKMLAAKRAKGKNTGKWQTSQDVMNWWLREDNPSKVISEEQFELELLI
jgi:hypothetical protein